MTDMLLHHIDKNRFNSERAREILGMAVDNAVWDLIKRNPMRGPLYRLYLKAPERKATATQLANIFTKNGAISDQRPARRFLRLLLGA